MPAYFSDTPTLADRRAQRTANATKRKREKALATLKDRKPLRSSSPSRTAPPKRKARIVKKARPAKETRRIYGPVEFRDYLHRHACLGCGYKGEAIQQAHLRTGGVGRKDDWTRTGPLCGPRLDGGTMLVGCHWQHDEAKRSWLTRGGLTFAEAQRQFFAEWEAFAGRFGGREGR